MRIIDPGHIYEIYTYNVTILLKFVKRSGGAVCYEKQWPGIQTQAVMRALIWYLEFFLATPNVRKTFPLWQLGSDDPYPITIEGLQQVYDILEVLIDRSKYLNNILVCVETSDACVWLDSSRKAILEIDELHAKCEQAIYGIRMALWCYEARAYRRKQEEVNRKLPEHDDSARMKEWRDNPCDDVPFNEVEIEDRPIGLDGHLVLANTTV